jgi:hypothetical protein
VYLYPAGNAPYFIFKPVAYFMQHQLLLASAEPGTRKRIRLNVVCKTTESLCDFEKAEQWAINFKQ